MRYYVIINGVNSLTKTGLAIKELPPITKPLMRTQIEEIDGRDGDIITELGYSAYDKELEIGLYGEGYDINDIIAFFNNSGTIVFSNEPDKYYNFKIIEQIDYEKLLKFKTAIIKIHVQPFKYPLNETPIEITEKTITVEGENLSIDNTMEAPIKIDLKGNTYQYTTTGKNLLDDTQTDVGSWGTDGEPTTNNRNRRGIPYIPVLPNTTYTISANMELSSLRINEYDSEKNPITRKSTPSRTTSFTITTGGTTYFLRWSVNYDNSTAFTEEILLSLQLQLEQGTERTSYEKFTGGQPSPNPDYPQDIQVVKGDNTIKVVGKNLIGLTTNQYPVDIRNGEKYVVRNDASNNLTLNLYTNYGDETRIDYWTIESQTTRKLTASSDIGAIKWTVTPNGLAWINKGETLLPYEEYQEQSFPINLPVKNLFDKNNVNVINGYPGDGGFIASSNNAKSIYIAIQPNKTYTVSKVVTSRFGLATTTNIPITQEIYNQFISHNSYENITIKTSNNDNYLLVYLYNSNYDTTISLEDVLDTLQIEEGSNANSYTPFGVEPIELCKIGQYQDYLFKDNGKWYKHKEIDKQIFIGNDNESWTLQTTNTSGYSRFRTTLLTTLIRHTSGSSEVFEAYSNMSVPISVNDTYALVDGIGCASSGNIFVYYDTTKEYTLNEFKNWLSTNNLILYYQLATPINEEITDTTLINQLEDLESAFGYDNQTNIIQSNDNLPFILNVTAFLDTNLKATINNIGNIYSKPILDIKATGIVGIYLEGNQIFSVDLSNDDECIIDTNRLEAYDPATQNLMNRKVTGDYNLFKLNIGNNNVSATGDVDKITVTNYTRWL